MSMGTGRPKAAEQARLSFLRRVGDHLEKAALGVKKLYVQLFVAYEDHRERREHE